MEAAARRGRVLGDLFIINHLQRCYVSEEAKLYPETPVADRWYALLTKSRAEKACAARLDEAGIVHYLPLINQLHQWKDRRKQITVPLFPGYLFVRIADSGVRVRVLQTEGAVRMLGFVHGPEPIPDGEIDAIRQLLASGLPFKCHPFLRGGEHVRVCRGPLRGIEGQFVRSQGRARLVLSVEMLSRAVAVEIDRASVELLASRCAQRRRA